MTSRLPKHLHDALTAARLAQEFLGELDADAYRSNELVRSAVERQMEILGEACKRALDEAPELRGRLPDLGLAIGLRNQLIHAYDRVIDSVVLDTVRRDLPGLMAKLDTELRQYPLT